MARMSKREISSSLSNFEAAVGGLRNPDLAVERLILVRETGAPVEEEAGLRLVARRTRGQVQRDPGQILEEDDVRSPGRAREHSRGFAAGQHGLSRTSWS